MTILDSPNQGPRPKGVWPSLIVVHGTEGSDAGDVDWIMRKEAEVSYHRLVKRTGEVTQFVPDSRRAWHAGKSSWEGRDNCNDYSLGIGFSARKGEGFTDAAYTAGAKVVAGWMRTYSIPFSGVVGHYHVSPGRKTDPWDFHWMKFAGEVLSFYMVTQK